MTRAGDSRRQAAARTGPRATHVRPGGLVRALHAAPQPLVAAVLIGLAALIAAPVLAATPPTGTPATKTAPKPKFSFEMPLTPFQPPITDTAKFSFTASGGAAASARTQTVERAFRFTPSGQGDNHGDDRRALSLGVSTRVVAAAVDHSHAAPPVETLAAQTSAYNVDLSLAWRGFAVNTGYGQVDPGPLELLANRRDSVDVGISYRGKNWKTSLQGTAERGALLAYAPLERRYSVELGGAYALAPRFSVSGGVRYRLAPVSPSLLDVDRPDQSVYLGTNIAF